MGTGVRGAFLASATGSTVARVRLTGHSYILRSISIQNNVVGVSAGKPLITIKKAAEPSTTTATGTAITGATLTMPAAQAAGSVVKLRNLHSAISEGDQITLCITAGATKAFTMSAWAELEPCWEYTPNTGVSTVTA